MFTRTCTDNLWNVYHPAW